MGEKSFKSFGLKALTLLALIIAIDKAVGFAFVKMKDYGLRTNPECMWLKTPFVVEKVDSDVLIIGSSRASHHYVPSIIADSLGFSVYNCGQDGCFFIYQNCLINMVLDRYLPKMIIWDIQPECFNTYNDMPEYQNIRYLSPYYDKSPWATEYINSEGDLSSVKMKCKMFAYNSKLLNFLSPLVINGTSTTDNGYIPLPSDGYKYPELEIPSVDNPSYQADSVKLSLFAKTIYRCRADSIRLVIVSSPRLTLENKAYLELIGDLQNVAMKYGTKVYDYGNLYIKDSSLFKDNSHLNNNGAVAFSQYMIHFHNLSSKQNTPPSEAL